MTAQLIEGGGKQDQLVDSLNNRFYGYYWGAGFLLSEDREVML